MCLYYLHKRDTQIMEHKFIKNEPSNKQLQIEKPKTSANPTGEYSFFTVQHKKNFTPLYPKKLSISHVAQGARSGDCYLLSVINAIIALPNGEQYIRGTMIEQKNKVHVRFFRDDEPQWLILEKSLPTSWGILSSGANWVRFLEKAYVTFMGGNYNKTLSSGDSRNALKAFLGGFNDSIATSKQAECSLAELYKKVIYGCNGKDIYSLIFLLRPHDKLASIPNMCQYVFANQPELLEAWWNWVKLHQKHFEQLLKNHLFLTKEVFIACMKERMSHSISPPAKAIAAVEQWLHQHAVLPEENKYSYDEERLFLSLKSAHEEQKPIVCSPKEDPPEGITMQHTYALIGIKESKISHRKFVILRNPHHENRNWFSHYFFYGGRHSIERQENGIAKLTISPVEQSTFTMELRDFAHAFAYIDCGRSLLAKQLHKRCEETLTPM
ncbi:coiled-coil protein [Fluoribacter gormanii]|uniref:Calpain family cysteine protease n=2 Tax=Fluoribacter gormanii TaxID=464 RepID=A0A377GFN7_9GAMM|nr:coiled-coil protein [Fluoribacter gormanii]SIR69233.1 Calpain family cysteine protease [Fluoribacter gormanii]STO23639.1 Calpain family cysteine protease [Fluoribacter gormanii]